MENNMSKQQSLYVENVKTQISKIEKLVYEHIKKNNDTLKEIKND